MDNRVFKMGDIRKIIKESSQEFNPKMGANVENDNKKNNEKSYKQSAENVKKFTGIKNDNKKADKNIDRFDDLNRGLMDFNPQTEPDETFKKRVKAQIKGYNTIEDEKRGSKDKNGDFENNEKIYGSLKKKADAYNDAKSNLEHSGLVGSKIPKEKKTSMFETAAPKPKRLVFKKTKFMNEAQMLSRIPEEYKKHGQIIYMKDMDDNEYIVECQMCNKTNLIETNILNYNNERLLNEQLNRMQELFSYENKGVFNTSKNMDKARENEHFNNNLSITRANQDKELD